MSTEGQHDPGTGADQQPGSTVPDAPDGVAAGTTGEPNTFEPEEAAPAAGQEAGEAPAPGEAAGAEDRD